MCRSHNGIPHLRRSQGVQPILQPCSHFLVEAAWTSRLIKRLQVTPYRIEFKSFSRLDECVNKKKLSLTRTSYTQWYSFP